MVNVLLIGDLIIDKFTYGKKLGISAETPTVVAEFSSEKTLLGGAGLVMRHLLNLGCTVSAFLPGPSLIVDAADSQIHEDLMNDIMFTDVLNIRNRRELFSDWKYTTKHRFFVDGYKMVQFDDRNKKKLGVQKTNLVISLIEKHLEEMKFDAIVIADNRHGFMNYTLARAIVKLSKSHNVPLYVDSQISQSEGNHDYYEGATNLLLNENEYFSVCNTLERSHEYYSDGSPEKDLPRIASLFALKNVYVKLGAQGACRYDGKKFKTVKAPKVNVVDTCGAGDAFLAMLVASKGNLKKAVDYASLSVKLPGTSVPVLKGT